MYVPNAGFLGIDLKSLKVEFWFVESKCEGDMVGRPSPYPNIHDFPDAKIDATDWYFFQGTMERVQRDLIGLRQLIWQILSQTV